MTKPIGEKFASISEEFLSGQIGREIDSELVQELQHLLRSTLCDFVGITEASEILEISRQRVGQINMPEEAGRILAAGFWLREDVDAFKNEREARRERHMGIPKP